MDVNCNKIREEQSFFFQRVIKEQMEYRIEGNKTNKGIVEGQVQKHTLVDTPWCNILPLQKLDKTIAIQIHIFYQDLLPEFFNYLNNMPYVFDLYISCPADADKENIINYFSKLRFVNDVIVRETINQGRDMAPFYVLFREEIMAHDYVLHFHSKKSLYTGTEQQNWRRHMLECLLGTTERIQKIFMLLESEQHIGMFFPENTDILFINQIWTDEEKGKKFLEEYGIEYKDVFFSFPVGNFFWAKCDALKPLFDRAYQYAEFDKEEGQKDATLAHTLERGAVWISWKQGYHNCICDLEEDVIHFDEGVRPYRRLRYRTEQTTLEYLSLFDLIAIDIYGTLIVEETNRCRYQKIVKRLLEQEKTVIAVMNRETELCETQDLLARRQYDITKIKIIHGKEVEDQIYEVYKNKKIVYVSDNLRSELIARRKIFYYSQWRG